MSCLLGGMLLFASCDDNLSDERTAELENYYAESLLLSSPQVDADSIRRFSDKVAIYAVHHPHAVRTPLYAKIQDNIRLSLLHLGITFNPDWEGEIHIGF